VPEKNGKYKEMTCSGGCHKVVDFIKENLKQLPMK
jgi:hypothetical protein